MPISPSTPAHITAKQCASVKPGSQALADILRRKDTWRGNSQKNIGVSTVDTGFSALNAQLNHHGWPEGCLIELAQANFAATWFLFGPSALSLLRDRQGQVVLLNPPAMPYALGLAQLGVDLDDLLVLTPQNKADFIACFVELARSSVCSMLLAWQPRQKMNYTELRKCQLATCSQAGVYILQRHPVAMSQSSPASLRLLVQLHARTLALTIAKQKGGLPGVNLALALPDAWFSLSKYSDLASSCALPRYKQGNATPWLQRSALPRLVKQR